MYGLKNHIYEVTVKYLSRIECMAKIRCIIAGDRGDRGSTGTAGQPGVPGKPGVKGTILCSGQY